MTDEIVAKGWDHNTRIEAVGALQEIAKVLESVDLANPGARTSEILDQIGKALDVFAAALAELPRDEEFQAAFERLRSQHVELLVAAVARQLTN